VPAASPAAASNAASVSSIADHVSRTDYDWGTTDESTGRPRRSCGTAEERPGSTGQGGC